jgi:signal transduction histidine kinase
LGLIGACIGAGELLAWPGSDAAVPRVVLTLLLPGVILATAWIAARLRWRSFAAGLVDATQGLAVAHLGITLGANHGVDAASHPMGPVVALSLFALGALCRGSAGGSPRSVRAVWIGFGIVLAVLGLLQLLPALVALMPRMASTRWPSALALLSMTLLWLAVAPPRIAQGLGGSRMRWVALACVVFLAVQSIGVHVTGLDHGRLLGMLAAAGHDHAIGLLLLAAGQVVRVAREFPESRALERLLPAVLAVSFALFGWQFWRWQEAVEADRAERELQQFAGTLVAGYRASLVRDERRLRDAARRLGIVNAEARPRLFALEAGLRREDDRALQGLALLDAGRRVVAFDGPASGSLVGRRADVDAQRQQAYARAAETGEGALLAGPVRLVGAPGEVLGLLMIAPIGGVGAPDGFVTCSLNLVEWTRRNAVPLPDGVSAVVEVAGQSLRVQASAEAPAAPGATAARLPIDGTGLQVVVAQAPGVGAANDLSLGILLAGLATALLVGTLARLAAVAARRATEANTILRQLDRSRQQLEQRNRELRDFTFVAAHDLQEPLRKVRLFAARLDDEIELPGRGREFLERAVRSAERLQEVIDAILRFARIDAAPLERDTVDLGAVWRDVLEELDALVVEGGATVEVAALPRVAGDAGLVRLAASNLLRNALKFRRDGVSPEIRIDAVDAGDFVGFAVVDNGIGFDPALAERIFRPFQQLNARERFGGSGMGLTIVRGVVERQGGRVAAQGDPGRGARFTVLLPAAVAPD